MHLSGLEALTIDKSLFRFVNVGERCNIAGSIQFKKLILAGKYQDAMAVARKQVRRRHSLRRMQCCSACQLLCVRKRATLAV
jgi:hypothetical protein